MTAINLAKRRALERSRHAAHVNPMASLIVQNATHRAAYALVGDVVMIGRASVNDIVISNPVVSARHAMLQKIGDTYWLKYLTSTNATHLNGHLLTYPVLQDAETIRFAS